jgi:hypothetical protein
MLMSDYVVLQDALYNRVHDRRAFWARNAPRSQARTSGERDQEQNILGQSCGGPPAYFTIKWTLYGPPWGWMHPIWTPRWMDVPYMDPHKILIPI